MSVGRSFRAVLIAVSSPERSRCAAVASAACPKGAQCATRDRPARPHAARPRARSRSPTRRCPRPARGPGTIVLLSGGPGQAAIPLTERRRGAARAAARRATTSSPSTSAGRATRARSTARSSARDDVAACAAKLGDRRAFFNTPETAKDLEDLRVALGVDKLTLLGVSYGAKVAGEYARRYPAHDRRARARLPRAGRRPRRLRPAAHARHAARAARGLLPRPLPRDRAPTPTRRWRRPSSGCRTARSAGRWSPAAARVTTVARDRGRRSTRRSSAATSSPALRAGPAGRDRLARRRATPRRCCTSARSSAPAAATAATSTPRGCWPRPASRAGCRGRRTRRSPSRADAREGVRRRARGRASRRSAPATVLAASRDRAVRELAADAEARERRLPRPGRPGARDLRPRRPAHAAGGRPPHRARSTRTRRCSPCRASATRSLSSDAERLRGRAAWSRSCAARRSRRARAPSPAAALQNLVAARTRRRRSARCARPAPPASPGRTFSAVTSRSTGVGYDARASPPRRPLPGPARGLRAASAHGARAARRRVDPRRARLRHAELARRGTLTVSGSVGRGRDGDLHAQERDRDARRAARSPRGSSRPASEIEPVPAVRLASTATLSGGRLSRSPIEGGAHACPQRCLLPQHIDRDRVDALMERERARLRERTAQLR